MLREEMAAMQAAVSRSRNAVEAGAAAMVRAMASVGPPGGKAITMRIGREASWAWEVAVEAARTSSALTKAARRDGTESSHSTGRTGRYFGRP